MKFTNLTISCVVFFFSVTSAAIAETTEEKIQKYDEEISILKKEKEKIDAEFNLEQQKQKLLKLKLPNLTTKTEGKIEFTKLKIENQISAYRAMDKIADKVQKEIIENLGSDISLIIFDSTSTSNPRLSLLKSHLEYKSYKDTVNKLKKEYEKLGIVSTSNVAAGVEYLFDTLKLFRTDTDFTGSDVTIENRAFIANLANKMRENNKSVSIYYPKEYPLISGDATEKIIGELNQLKQYQKITENILLTETNKERRKELEQFSDKVKNFIDEIIVNPKLSLEDIIKYATFQNIKDKGKVYLLSIEIVAAGGTIRKTKNIFNSRLRFSGGVIINYIVYDYDKAEIVFSNLHDEYTGFKKIRSSK